MCDLDTLYFVTTDCPGVKIKTETGEQKCFLVHDGNEMDTEKTFTYIEAKTFCYLIGGRLPVNNTWKEREHLLFGIKQYALEPVSFYKLNQAKLMEIKHISNIRIVVVLYLCCVTSFFFNL